MDAPTGGVEDGAQDAAPAAGALGLSALLERLRGLFPEDTGRRIGQGYADVSVMLGGKALDDFVTGFTASGKAKARAFREADWGIQAAFVQAKTELLAFAHAIDWTDPFIVCLLLFHLLVLVTAWSWRDRAVGQLFIYLVLAALTFSAQSLNDYCREHWREMGIRQNYFDRRGVFMMIMFCAPMLAVTLFMTVHMLYQTASLMVMVGASKVRARARAEGRATKAEEGAGGSGSGAVDSSGDKKAGGEEATASGSDPAAGRAARRRLPPRRAG